MRPGFLIGTFIAASAMAMLACPHAGIAESRGESKGDATMITTTKTQIPKSIQVEHEAIHSLLIEATRAPGRVGVAAKALAEVLHPHFVREEEIALPPLGLLADLAARKTLPENQVDEVLTMTDALRNELPQMIEEHQRIRAAVDDLRQAAKAEQATKYENLADQLAVHAQNEEEVLYPAAILVGDLLRATRKEK